MSTKYGLPYRRNKTLQTIPIHSAFFLILGERFKSFLQSTPVDVNRELRSYRKVANIPIESVQSDGAQSKQANFLATFRGMFSATSRENCCDSFLCDSF